MADNEKSPASDDYWLMADMDRVTLRTEKVLDMAPWEAVRLAKRLLELAECAQLEVVFSDLDAAQEKPAAWSSSLFPASEIEVGDHVGGYEVAAIESEAGTDGRLTATLLTDRGSRMTVFFDPNDKVPLEKSR
jgi:hypothetical protein